MKIQINRDLKISLLRALQVGIIDLSVFNTEEYEVRALTKHETDHLNNINHQVTIFQLPDNGRN